MRHIFVLCSILFIISSCSTVDKSKIERQILLEGKYDCETEEYYQAYSETIPNKNSQNPSATITVEEYACARPDQIPPNKEIKPRTYFDQLKTSNPSTIYMLFLPCQYAKNTKFICK